MGVMDSTSPSSSKYQTVLGVLGTPLPFAYIHTLPLLCIACRHAGPVHTPCPSLFVPWVPGYPNLRCFVSPSLHIALHLGAHELGAGLELP